MDGSRSYGDLVSEVCSRTTLATPPGARVAILSKGDPALLALPDRVGMHFPQQDDGEFAAYFQRVAKENLGEMMEFESDRMTNLVLTDAMVATERDVVLNERRDRVEKNPDAILNEALLRILYLNHPYGRPIIGWNHEILELDRQTALDFYHRYYTPNNAVLVVAGDVTPEEVRRLAEDDLRQDSGRGPRRCARRARPSRPRVGPRTVTVRDEKVREPQLQRAYIVPSAVTAEPGEAEALSLLAEILGGGATSRFYDKLVRGDGAATYAGANYRSSGLDDIALRHLRAAEARRRARASSRRAWTRSIAELQENGITEEELGARQALGDRPGDLLARQPGDARQHRRAGARRRPQRWRTCRTGRRASRR